jgi:hypothetical protein
MDLHDQSKKWLAADYGLDGATSLSEGVLRTGETIRGARTQAGIAVQAAAASMSIIEGIVMHCREPRPYDALFAP